MNESSQFLAFLWGQFRCLFGFLLVLFALCAIYNLARGLMLHRPKEPESPSSQEGLKHLRRVRKYLIWMTVMFSIFNFIPSRKDVLMIEALKEMRVFRFTSYAQKLRDAISKMEKVRSNSDPPDPPSDRELMLEKESLEATIKLREKVLRLISALDGKGDSARNGETEK